MSRIAATVLGLAVLFVGAPTATAGEITFNGITVTTTLNGDAIDVDVTNVPGGIAYGLFGGSGANRAFGFNVIDPDDLVSISDLTPGFSYTGAGDVGGGFGDFEFLINGPQSPSDAALPLHFRVTRTGGFTDDSAVYEPNALGFVFAAHIKELDGGRAQFVGATINAAGELAPVPEPASLLLLGTGLCGIVTQAFRRRQRP